MQDIIRNAPDIIREAARSSLGLAALIILALAIIGVIFFKKEEVRLKTLMFILMFIGFIVLGYAFSRVSDSPQIPNPASNSAISPSLPNTPTPMPTNMPSPTTATAWNTPKPTPSQPEPPLIANDSASWAKLIYGMQWHIKAIQPKEKLSRFYIEIRNIDEQNERSFYSFNKAPLVVIDDSGNSYKMLNSSDAPEDIRELGEGWHLQPKRAITVAVDFAPLGNGKTSGHIVYRDNNNAEPAKFSFAP